MRLPGPERRLKLAARLRYPEFARPGLRARKKFLFAFLLSTTASLVTAGGEIPARLMPDAAMLETLRRSGLVGGGIDPVPAFTWVLERRRPGREPRQSREVFGESPGGSLAGLALMVRSYLPQAKGDSGRQALSVRGLTTVDADDESAGVNVEGLRLPLTDGARFSLKLKDGESMLEQTCVAGTARPAAGLHADIPGSARQIDCSGRGSYRGLPVKVNATLHYFERLGVFVRSESVLNSPFGPYRSTVRVISFSMP